MDCADLRSHALDDAGVEVGPGSDCARWLERMSPEARIEWALAQLPGAHVLSSSFGAQSAVLLHMATRIRPDLPVILIDTGYLFPETYAFVDRLVAQLDLNLRIYQSPRSTAWMEAREGRLWEQGVEGIERYNQLRKVEPMQRALRELGAGTWFSGLRRSQSDTRERTPIAEYRNGHWKVHPIADWRDYDVGRYLARHGLPYHPLWDEGYVSIGDTHSTTRWQPGMREQDTRFGGLVRECGIHLEA
ncbi:MAG: phosphoadenylyl-sulfate reductase [Xanthomonadales bacterium]|nr:phosphoadenylyl-sulfate reductase [Xanthomonadales bacterium]